MSGSEEKIDEVRNGPILHVVVVGFHHKRGCQVCCLFVLFRSVPGRYLKHIHRGYDVK